MKKLFAYSKRGVSILTILSVAVVATASFGLYQPIAEAHAPSLAITYVDGQSTADPIIISTDSLPTTVDVTIYLEHEVNALEVKELVLFVNGTQHDFDGDGNPDFIDPNNSLCDGSSCTINMQWTIASSGNYELYASAYHGNKNEPNPIGISATVEITVAPPNDQTITFETIPAKTYGDPDFDLIASASSGLPVSFNSQTEDVCTVGESTAHIVTAGNCTIVASQVGDDTYNPALDVDQTFNIAKKSLSITASDQVKTVGTSFVFSGVEFTPSGLVNSDSISSVTLFSDGAYIGAAVNTYPIIPSDAVGTGLDNYSISYNNGTFTVNDKTTPIISWSNPTEFTYGTLLDNAQLNATADVSGSFIYTPASGTKLNAGNDQNLHVDFTPDDSTNYNNVSKDVQIDVLKKSITVTAVTDTKVYDGTTSSTGTPAIDGDLISGDTANFIQTFDTPDVGNNKILTPSGSITDGNNGNNYDVTIVTNNTGVITAAEPTDEEQCELNGGTWNGESCDMPPTDTDEDSVPDTTDNCDLVTNPGQEDNDSDGIGDVCDNDDDNDGQTDADETSCGSDPLNAESESTDTDNDNIPNCVDTDDDNDTILDDQDNCDLVANTDQADADGDGIGDVCDSTNNNEEINNGGGGGGGGGSTSSGSGITNYIINAFAGLNGFISPSGLILIPFNGSQTFSIIANAGFQIANVIVDGVFIGPVSSYTFSNVTENHVITALFSEAPVAPEGVVLGESTQIEGGTGETEETGEQEEVSGEETENSTENNVLQPAAIGEAGGLAGLLDWLMTNWLWILILLIILALAYYYYNQWQKKNAK